MMERPALSLAPWAHQRQAPRTGQTLNVPSHDGSNRIHTQHSSPPGPPFGIDAVGFEAASITERIDPTIPNNHEPDDPRSEDPSQHLLELCERLRHSNTLQWQLIEEVHRTLEPLSAGGNLQGCGLPARVTDLERFLNDDPSASEGLTVEADHRITYGTDRLRAGAGACELVCNQAVLFEIGCLLLSHAKRCQERAEPDS